MKRLLELENGRWGHASGALWVPACAALLIADLHIGYSWAQRRRGELGPLTDHHLHTRLHAVIDELAPATVVLLGDIVHAPRPSEEENRLISDLLTGIATHRNLVLVRGNHDRGFARDFATYSLVTEWRADGLLAVHGDRLPPVNEEHLILGHFHPSYSPRDAAGARQKLPVFAWTAQTTILPAFSPFAAGADLHRHWTPALGLALGTGIVNIAACTGNQIARLPFRRPA